jgi:hypothetical protein
MSKKVEAIECTINGKTRTLGEWAKFRGLTGELIRARLRYGWSLHDAYTLPKGWFVKGTSRAALARSYAIRPGASKIAPAR